MTRDISDRITHLYEAIGAKPPELMPSIAQLSEEQRKLFEPLFPLIRTMLFKEDVWQVMSVTCRKGKDGSIFISEVIMKDENMELRK